MSKFFKQKNKRLGGGFTRTPIFGVTPKGGGFTLVETLVAISIFSLSILGLLVVLSQGIADTGYAKKKMAATYLAQEGIEYVRNFRDTSVLYDSTSAENGWREFQRNFTDELLPQPEDSSFRRIITLDIVDENQIKVSSTVFWRQGSGDYEIAFSENLYNWME